MANNSLVPTQKAGRHSSAVISTRNMIANIEEIVELFNIFHDGDMCHYSTHEHNLSFSVVIPYIANRINPKFTQFFVTLYNCHDISFQTWPDETGHGSKILNDLNEIFKPKLWILDGSIKNNKIAVACSQADPSLSYCGGGLYFTASSVKVTDEAGKEYTIEELGNICEAYWDEWEKEGERKNKIIHKDITSQ